MLNLANEFAIEADKLEEEDDPFYDDREATQEEKWDCETILSTYTNTDNHPGVIRTQKRIRPSQ